MLRFPIALLIGATLMAVAPRSGRANDFAVARANFAAAIIDREPSQILGHGHPAAPGPVWFWSEIRANRTAIAQFRADKRLPLQHRWYRDVGGSPGKDIPPDFVRVLEEIDDAKMTLLLSEATERSFFTYRTSSCRFNIPPGLWIAKVTDQFGVALPCDDGSSCRFEVRVRAGGTPAAAPCGN